MAVSASKTKYVFDGDASVELRAVSAGATTAGAATRVETGISLNALDTAYWHNNETPWRNLVISVQITALVTGGGETYEFQLIADDDSGMAGGVVVAAQTVPSTYTGNFDFVVDAATLDQFADNAGTEVFLATQVVQVGVSAAATYGAQIAKNIR